MVKESNSKHEENNHDNDSKSDFDNSNNIKIWQKNNH